MEEFVKEYLNQGKRIDGRGLKDYRQIEIKHSIVSKAEGSAFVNLGGTKVVAGVKLDIGEPFPDTPNEGILIVNAELTPLSSPEIEPGPPGEEAIELARIVDRVIRESETIELGKLFIENDKVWIVYIDLAIFDIRGNLTDASVLAAVEALLHTQIPKIENEKIVRGEFVSKLPVAYKPVSITIGKYNDNLLVDLNKEEEEIINAKLVVGVRDDDKICTMQKQGIGTFSLKDVENALDLAIEKSKELRRLL
jgi:exosome complex component RRP42